VIQPGIATRATCAVPVPGCAVKGKACRMPLEKVAVDQLRIIANIRLTNSSDIWHAGCNYIIHIGFRRSDAAPVMQNADGT
jgi:hypothetical protein